MATGAANGATSSGRASGSSQETAVLASRFDRRKGRRSGQEIRLLAFRRRSWRSSAPEGGKEAICCWSVLRSAAAASAAAVAWGEGGADTGSSVEAGAGGEAADGKGC